MIVWLIDWLMIYLLLNVQQQMCHAYSGRGQMQHYKKKLHVHIYRNEGGIKQNTHTHIEMREECDIHGNNI